MKDDTQLVIELVRQSIDTAKQAEQRICERLNKVENKVDTFQVISTEKQAEFSEAVNTLQTQVVSLQQHTKRNTKALVLGKKKALRRLSVRYLPGLQLRLGNLIIRN